MYLWLTAEALSRYNDIWLKCIGFVPSTLHLTVLVPRGLAKGIMMSRLNFKDGLVMGRWRSLGFVPSDLPFLLRGKRQVGSFLLFLRSRICLFTSWIFCWGGLVTLMQQRWEFTKRHRPWVLAAAIIIRNTEGGKIHSGSRFPRSQSTVAVCVSRPAARRNSAGQLFTGRCPADRESEGRRTRLTLLGSVPRDLLPTSGPQLYFSWDPNNPTKLWPLFSLT